MFGSLINFYIYTLKNLRAQKNRCMKKIYLAVFLACSMGGAVHAQISEGGLPWSIGLKKTGLTGQSKVISIDAPDFKKLKLQDLEDAKTGNAKPYRAGMTVAANIDLSSGTMVYLEDGRKIWTATVQMISPDLEALNFYYDKFNLPEGVRYYITNGNEKQFLGAYTYRNNNEFNTFVNEPVQGGIVKLELNIDANVKLSDIQFHIDRISALDRGQSALVRAYASDEKDGGVLKPTVGESSSCEINAICPQGTDYPNQRKSEARILISAFAGSPPGYCSGTLITDAAGSCKPYFLTASHCDDANQMDDARFSDWVFQFNYESANCDGTGTIGGNSITGAKFRARSFYPSFPSSNPHSSKLVGDFILLELNNLPPDSWGAYMSGWNRNPFPPNLVNDPVKKYIGFHHPAGDIKKVSYGKNVDPNGAFNQTTVPSTHWFIAFDPNDGGGMEGGSSGSGLFDGDGRLIGDLSGGRNSTIGDCPNLQGEEMGRAGLYSKFFTNWENTFDNTQTGFGAKFRLKDWLDPNNQNIESIPGKAIPCVPPSGIKEQQELLENSTLLYPNPASNTVHLKVNFNKAMNLKVEVFNILGASQARYVVPKSTSADFGMDVSSLPNGVYLFEITSGDVKTTKKITITR